MKNQIYTQTQIINYLSSNGFSKTFRRNIYDGYYNIKTNEHVLVPFDKETRFSVEELNQLFIENQKALELPPHLEWCRFQLFNHKKNN